MNVVYVFEIILMGSVFGLLLFAFYDFRKAYMQVRDVLAGFSSSYVSMRDNYEYLRNELEHYKEDSKRLEK